MKNKITVMKKQTIKTVNKEVKIEYNLEFFLNVGKEEKYLFTQKFTKGVYEYFKDGRYEDEVYRFKRYERNPRLDKTIDKLPMYIKSAERELAA